MNYFKKRILLPFALTLIMCAPNALGKNQLTAVEIIEKGNEVSKVAGMQSVATLTIIDQKGRKRIRNYAQVSKMESDGDTEKVLMKFLSPADVKGIGILTYDYHEEDDDIWIYMPSLRKTRRIISSQKSKSFMGSEFSYADTSRPVTSDFNYKKLGQETIGKENCWIIEVIPKDDERADENGYSKKISWISKKDFLIRKEEFYDFQGELFKRLDVKDVKEIDVVNHKSKLMHIIMTNVKNNRKSIFKYGKVTFTPDNKDEYFTSRYLEKGR